MASPAPRASPLPPAPRGSFAMLVPRYFFDSAVAVGVVVGDADALAQGDPSGPGRELVELAIVETDVEKPLVQLDDHALLTLNHGRASMRAGRRRECLERGSMAAPRRSFAGERSWAR